MSAKRVHNVLRSYPMDVSHKAELCKLFSLSILFYFIFHHNFLHILLERGMCTIYVTQSGEQKSGGFKEKIVGFHHILSTKIFPTKHSFHPKSFLFSIFYFPFPLFSLESTMALIFVLLLLEKGSDI